MKNKLFSIFLGRRSLVIFLLLAQLLFTVAMLWHSGIRNSAFGTFMTFVSLLAVLYITGRSDKEGYKLTWVVLIMLFPIVGGPLYLIFRIQSSAPRIRRKMQITEKKARELFNQNACVLDNFRADNPYWARQSEYLAEEAGFPVYNSGSPVYYSDGADFFEALEDKLRGAGQFIFLEYFIIDRGTVWDRIFAILKEKAAAGVDVRVMYDDLGCLTTLPAGFAAGLERASVKCAVFNPFRPFWSTYQNNRDHRKIAVIDGLYAFTGGINLADEYCNRVERFGHWKDAAIRVDGDAVQSFTLMFLQMWNAYYPRRDEDYSVFLRTSAAPGEGGYIQPYCDSPNDDENVGEHVYRSIISTAHDYVYMVSPYLILEDSMISALTLAAKSGVDVRIVIPGVPDKYLVYMTSLSYCRHLIRCGVKVYLYTPGFNHAKIFVADDLTATVGTANLDFRSLYLHYECGVLLHSSPAVGAVKKDFLNTLSDCRLMTEEDCKVGFFRRILQIVMRLYAPLI